MNTDVLAEAVAAEALLDAAQSNLEATYQSAPEGSVARRAIDDLIAAGAWTELNDRFFKTLSFGTGGIRGRTIGKVIAAAEQGNASGPCPAHACIGTNAMNDANIERATRGLCRYMRQTFPSITPTLVLSHDTRYFSRYFAELAARVATSEGVNAILFPEDRSTPQLSFTVRHLGAQAGAMITASHNPPHDNGFKAYFEDGGQMVEPHASNVIRLVEGADVTGECTPQNGAKVETLGPECDEAYLAALETVILDREQLRARAPQLKVVFTPLHGTGLRSVGPLLERLGVQVALVEEQVVPDGGFPTVRSPNPENGEALALGIEKARRLEADAVIATDPDADRMGVALRDGSGEYRLITGNQIGSLLAHHRITTLFEQGVLTRENAGRACLIKTFVTTDLQAAIAEKFGLKVINTLTGFKFIGEKLLEYERSLGVDDYGTLAAAERRRLHLERGCFFVFGGEESYGYSGGDFVRDKDANAAVAMFIEAAAAARASGRSLLQVLDDLYAEFGYFEERLGQIQLEGAEGARKIREMLQSFEETPPTTLLDQAVIWTDNFRNSEIRDVDGKILPKELMLFFHLANGTRVAVRGSGTEPKVKFYMFARTLPPAGNRFDAERLAAVKRETGAYLTQLWAAIERDAMQRVGD